MSVHSRVEPGQAQPVNPRFDRAQIELAAARIANRIRRTPLLEVAYPDPALAHPPNRKQPPETRQVPNLERRQLNLKLEYLQVSGTFKARGAFNRLLSAAPAELARGVVAASGGNHGIAIAYAAQQLGVSAHIFVPSVSSPAKQAKLRELGAQVRVVGDHYADALAASERFALEHGALRSHAYDQAETLAGQGTLAREWLEQAPQLDTVLVAVGGGGLIGGIAAWLEGRVKVVAVESVGCPTLHSALAAGRPVPVAVAGLAADSLGAAQVGELMFPIAQRAIAQSLLVSDEQIRAAQRWLWDQARIAAEPGGATAMAAVLSGQYTAAADERVGVLICGGNLDPASLA